jgi:UDP:flavonoid glycosyltransferase YjiC (YdhE family)
MKTITFLASGTRGDVIPYIALGLGFRDAGFQVRVAAPIGFRQLIEPSGLTFAPFDGNPSDLMVNQTEPLTVGRNIFNSIRATMTFLRNARAIYPRMLQTAAEACRGSDAIVHGLPTLWGAHIAEGLRVPGIRAALQPLTPTREFASALLPFRSNFGRIGNWLSHWILIQAAWLSFRREVNRAHRTRLGLPRAHWLDPSLRPSPNQPLTLNGFSERIVPRPTDWDEKQIITGYWRNFGPGRLAAENPDPPTSHIHRFIEHSPEKTIAVGLGSPGTQSMLAFIELLDEALKKSEAQAILTIPKEWHKRFISTRILPVEYAPHDWLYRHVRAAVHHGGAGTTSASLHAGIPSAVLPLAIDQFFWGERVHKIGAGPEPIPQRALNAEKLAKAIQIALWDESIREKVKRISVALSLEDGVQVAVSTMRGVV